MQLAIYDLDHTLIAGDSASLWLSYMVEIGWASADLLKQEQRLMNDYVLGKMAIDEYMQLCLKPMIGRHQAEVAQQVQDFIQQKISLLLYTDAVYELVRTERAGCERLIISATADFLVKPIAQYLDVRHVLAINTELKEGCYTGRTVGTATYQNGKVERLREWLAAGREFQSMRFYSDSCNDLPLLLQVEAPYPVNPDEKLLAYARERNWPVLAWS